MWVNLFTVIHFEHVFDMSYLLNVVGCVIATMKYKYSFLLSLPQMQGYINQQDSKPNLDLKKKKFIVKVQVPMGSYALFYLVKLVKMLKHLITSKVYATYHKFHFYNC